MTESDFEVRADHEVEAALDAARLLAVAARGVLLAQPISLTPALTRLECRIEDMDAALKAVDIVHHGAWRAVD